MPNDDSPDDDVAATLREFNKALSDGRTEDAQTSALEFLALASQHADQEPSQDLLLNQGAHRCESFGDWQGAESLYRQSLALAEAQEEIGNIFAAHHNLSRLHTFLGRDQAALKESLLAIAAARRSALGPTMSSLLYLELMRKAQCELRLGDVSAARNSIAEMLERVPDSSMSAPHKARGLIVRACCELENDQTAKAEHDLNVAWSLLAPSADMSIFAAVHMGLAEWWETTAQLRAMNGDSGGVISALREAVDRRRHVASLPQLDGPYKYKALSDALHTLGEALRKIEQVAEAVESMTESNNIRQAIGLPSVEQQRDPLN